MIREILSFMKSHAMPRNILLFFTLFPSILLSQNVESFPEDSVIGYDISLDTDFSLLIGYGYNYSRTHFAEIGLAMNSYGTVGFHLHSSAIFISNELRLNQFNRPMFGPKIGVWTAGGNSLFSMGLNLIYYREDRQNSMMFRPEIGLGFLQFKLIYGYNIPFKKDNYLNLAKNNLSIGFFLKMKRTKEKRANFK